MTDVAAKIRILDISGKDFLTAEEAAHYACVSYSQFRAEAAAYGLTPFRWMGKTVYRKHDIQRAMERAADLAIDVAPDTPSTMRTGFQVLEASNQAHARRRRRAI